MGFYALFGLLWRPLAIGYAVLIVGLFFYLEFRPASNLFTLLFPAVVSTILGRGVHELQHTLLSWTLPNLRRRLFCSLLFVGIVTAFIVTWVYTSLDGPAPWLPIFTSVLFWYSMGLALSTNPVRDILLQGVWFFTVMLLVFSIDRIAEFYSAQPVLCVLMAVLGSSLCLYRIFDVNTARRKSVVSIKEVMASKGVFRRKWRYTGPLTGLFNWIRAGEYENFGFRRLGWPARAVVVSGMAVLGVVAIIYLVAGDMPAKVKQQNSPGFQRVVNMLVSVLPAIYAMMCSIDESLFLQKGWLYPLSRTQLARLAYWSGLLYNAVFCGTMVLIFLIRENLMEQYAGYDFIRPLTLIFIFTPVFQWLRLRYGPLFSLTLTGFVSICGLIGIVVLSWYLVKAAPHIPDRYEVVAFAGLILLSQCLFRYKVETYFKRGDLV